jgi:hypothetical protein
MNPKTPKPYFPLDFLITVLLLLLCAIAAPRGKKQVECSSLVCLPSVRCKTTTTRLTGLGSSHGIIVTRLNIYIYLLQLLAVEDPVANKAQRLLFSCSKLFCLYSFKVINSLFLQNTLSKPPGYCMLSRTECYESDLHPRSLKNGSQQCKGCNHPAQAGLR